MLATFKSALQKPIAIWKMLLIAFISGALMSLALPPYFFMPFCFLGFSSLVLFFDNLQNRPKKRRNFFLVSWFFGCGYFIFGLWWIGNALIISEMVAPIFAPLSILMLAVTLALYWGLAGLLCSLFWRPNLSRFFWIAFSFGLCEFLRGTLFTGFPWNAIGYTAMPTPLMMQSAAIFSVYGINILAVFIYSSPAVFLSPYAPFSNKSKAVLTSIVLCLCLAHIGFGYYRLNTAIDYTKEDAQKTYNVRIIQPSIDQNAKMDAALEEKTLNEILNLVAHPSKKGLKPDIIVWPETSSPYFLDYEPQVRYEIASMMPTGSFSLIGAARRTGTTREDVHFYNSIQVLDNGGTILDSSDKMHLVPFGEYLPLSDFFTAIGFKAVAEISGGYSLGEARKTVTLPNGLTYLPIVCYEIIFPTEMNYEGPKPSVIVNVTNDAWYGDSAGPLQHFHQAQVRAVELGLPVIRAANNGVSAVIDAYGQPSSLLTYNQIGIIDEVIPYSFVSDWNKNFNLFILFSVFLVFTIGIAILCSYTTSSELTTEL